MSRERRKDKKKWYDRRSRKIQEKGTREKARSFSTIALESKNYQIHVNHEKGCIATAPSIFSFVENLDETVQYFYLLFSLLDQRKFRQKFYIDSSKVVHVTVDALIYMIAVIYNMKANRAMRYSFTGNLPLDKKAREVFQQSGYLNYFKIKKLKMPDSTEYVEIVSGKTVESNTAKRICDFTIDKLGIGINDIKILYATLIELMSNTTKHAYNKKDKMAPCWYLYAISEKDKTIRYAFIDTGEGIPNTVRKKFIEKLSLNQSDAKWISVALKEAGRSETGLDYRGRGLPHLFKQVEEGNLKDFCVISGRGNCRFDKHSCTLICQDQENPIYGTIFCFCIERKT